MKHLLIIFLLININLIVKAQTKLDDYQMIYFKKSFDINVSQEKNDTSKYTYYIDGSSADARHEKVCLDIPSKSIPDFITFLNTAKQTYSKWQETAKANNVTELTKDIEIKNFKCGAAFVYGDWNFDFNILLSPRVKIVDGKMLLIIGTGELQSSSNQFMKHDGLLLAFTNTNEVDDFIGKLNLSKARALFSKKNNTDALFKN